jgi:peptide chain release factor 1
MEDALISRLQEMAAEYKRLLDELGSPEVASDHQRYAEVAKKAAALEDAVRAYQELQTVAQEADEAREMLGDAKPGADEDYLRTTLQGAEGQLAKLEERLRDLLVTKDPRDDRPILVELRAGAGGDEASLFAGELLRMYQRYAERHGWRADVLDVSEGGVGGIKEAVLEVKGPGAWTRLHNESGVHRVQRVPATESSGRTHTSTVTVAVLPEADEVDVEINNDDLDIDTYRAQGAGGQHVNTTDSAVRITHRPTGLVVTCQSERSQHQNKDRAMRILLTRLKALSEAQAHAELAAERRSQVGTGDRSEKIRTYNFPQNRVTDHRVGATVHGIQQVMDGDLDEIIDALAHADLEHAPS